MLYGASCHCGDYTARFLTQEPLIARSCSCGFCRRHGARTVSDPKGAAAFKRKSGHVYRFATGATDYLVCPACGVYLGAIMTIGNRQYATLNLNCILNGPHAQDAVVVDYGGETLEMKMERRLKSWTPVRDWEQLVAGSDPTRA